VQVKNIGKDLDFSGKNVTLNSHGTRCMQVAYVARQKGKYLANCFMYTKGKRRHEVLCIESAYMELEMPEFDADTFKVTV